jgi:hypothetical protein
VAVLAWESVREDFAFDGSLRDIYIPGTDTEAWQRMLEGLARAGYKMAWSRETAASGPLENAETAFSAEDGSRLLLSVWLEGVTANCHFFTPDEIEFDVDPREIAGQDQLNAILGFMTCLAASVGESAILTHENCPDAIVLRVSPNGDVERVAGVQIPGPLSRVRRP